MTPKEYFKKNYDRIYLTAKDIASRRKPPVSADEVMKEIERGYECKNLISHSKTIELNGTIIDISSCLEQIKDLEYETMVFYAVIQGKMVNFFQVKGDQFSCEFKDPELGTALIKLMNSFFPVVRDFQIYVCHNHPFVCNVISSDEDMGTYLNIKNIFEKFNALNKTMSFTVVDFAIVTKFDYLSFKQFDVL